MASKYDGATIEVVNWEKFNPRKDLKATTWFRLQNNLFEHEDFIDFTDGEFMTMVYLLSQCSKKQSGTIKISAAHAERIGRRKLVDLDRTVDKLFELHIVRITLNDPNADVTQTLRERDVDVTLRTKRDERDETKRDERDAATSGQPNASVTSDPVIASLSDSLTLDLLKKVKPEIQSSWLKLYDDPEFVKREIQQAAVWCQANPARRPKSDFARFLTKWLARGWERHRKTLPTQRVSVQGDYSFLEGAK